MKNTIIFVYIVCTCIFVEATTYYVSKLGDNGNACATAQSSGASAKLTVAAGISCLSSGDTLTVQAGTYIEELYRVLPNGSSGNYTILQGETFGTTIFRPSSVTNIGIYEPSPNAHHLYLKDVVLDCVSANPCRGIFFDRDTNVGHDHIVDGVEIKNVSCENCDALIVGYPSYNIIIRNSYIHDIQDATPGTSPNNSIYMQGSVAGSGNLVENNVFENIGAAGINVRCITGDGCSDVIARRNIVKNSVALFSSSGTLSNVQIYNNIGIDNESGVVVNNPANLTIFHNNTIHNTTGGGDIGACFRQGNPNAQLTSAQAALVTNNICSSTTQESWVPVDNFVGDPSFVNVAGEDFNLSLTSNAKDTATDGFNHGAMQAPELATCEATAANTVVLTYTLSSDPDFTPLLPNSEDVSKVTIQCDAGDVTESDLSIGASPSATVTISEPCSSGQTITASLAYDSIEDSALIGNLLNGRAFATASPVTCTNSIPSTGDTFGVTFVGVGMP